MERMVQGTFAPGNEWARECKFHHGNEESWELTVLITNVPDTSVPLLVFLRLSVLDLDSMYATDRCQTHTIA